MSLTVATLRERLAAFPEDAIAYAYEGEVCGVVIVNTSGQQLGVIETADRERPTSFIAALPCKFCHEPKVVARWHRGEPVCHDCWDERLEATN